ncbi:MAG: PucR family transcriptional regulator [Lachnospiraceae bacterium]|nr:PucR family transcriptional regulator [Lachnospiraceae bacterium]
MLSLSSLNSFDFFQQFQLIAGEKGLYKNITNVVILDYEGMEEEYVGFQTGDFVITNLMFAKDDPSKIYKSFLSLMEIGVSAFAIKTIFYHEIPEEVIALSNEYEVPIFTFSDIFIEDVILNITDYLRATTNYDYYEKLIDSFIKAPSYQNELQQLMGALNITYDYKQISSMYVGSISSVNDFSLQRIINKTQLALKEDKQKTFITVTKYKKGMLFLACFKSFVPKNLKKFWTDLLYKLSLQASLYCIGINDSTLPLQKADIGIRRALWAYRKGDTSKEPITTYSDLGYENISYSFMQDSYIRQYRKELIFTIEPECESVNDFYNTDTYLTLSSCIKHNFDMIKVGEDLYQHPNTIRYRIKKIKELLNITNDTYFHLVVAILTSD